MPRSPYPTARLASVLVLLYEKEGQIRVLLTTRSKGLRSHPGQTALPGGKHDASDVDSIDTAFREANEEVGLPRNLPSIHVLCVLRPFLSQYGLIVAPVVGLLTDLAVLDTLTPCEGEVDAIFEHPLEAILDPSLTTGMALAEKGSEGWPYEEELYNMCDQQWPNGMTYRMHRFRSAASPIKGLTADILLLFFFVSPQTMVAEIAFDRGPVYERWAPGQINTFSGIAQILSEQEVVSRRISGTLSESSHASRGHLPAA
ncbi:hypothetical protein EW145_g7568 [Phellinidium pouzarii]|uniref:Nudix hydrolase domain-containing protein n=1 Tax=Phellinidium pouzarii TaxID=167371 RepID=A0A4S4KLW4_9AGAM|nr:hypothetical protein EW145_g7568 [Phellinidium pouzarii]